MLELILRVLELILLIVEVDDAVGEDADESATTTTGDQKDDKRSEYHFGVSLRNPLPIQTRHRMMRVNPMADHLINAVSIVLQSR